MVAEAQRSRASIQRPDLVATRFVPAVILAARRPMRAARSTICYANCRSDLAGRR